MIWQDFVLMLGGFIFAPSLLFSIRSKNKPPLRTSLPTAIVLTAFVVVYVSLSFWLAVISTTLTAACWYLLAYQVRRVP